MPDFLLLAVHLVVLLAVLSLIAMVGRVVARVTRLPAVIGEILVSLLVGPAVLALAGPAAFTRLLPADVMGVLAVVGEAGLVLFLVGVVYRLQCASTGMAGRVVGRVTAGAFLLPLVMGLLFAGWVLWTGSPELRGTAPTSAFVLLLAVGLTVTAVPVLARIIEERKADLGDAGRLALMSSILMDTPAWLMLAVALGLAKGGVGGVAWSLTALAIGGGIAYLANRALSPARTRGWVARSPRWTAVLVGVVALCAGTGAHGVGLTAIFGAFLVGMMIPEGDRSSPWPAVAALVGKVGRGLVPVFFVVAGVTLSTGSLTSLPWVVTLVATTLAIVGKIAGGYLGARWAGVGHWDGLRVGVLVNTRGLTEIVVLQAGFTAGILTPALFVALLVMALTTTGLTGPLLSLIDRRECRDRGDLDRVPLVDVRVPHRGRGGDDD